MQREANLHMPPQKSFGSARIDCEKSISCNPFPYLVWLATLLCFSEPLTLMGTSALPSPASVSSLSLPTFHSHLDDWFTTDYLSAQPLTHDVSSSTSGSSSTSCSTSVDLPERRSFLHSNPLDGFHLSTYPALLQVGSPVISSNSNFKAESAFTPTSNSVSAISNSSMASNNSRQSSVAKHFQAAQGGSNHPDNTILKPTDRNASARDRSILTSAEVALSSRASVGAGATKASKRRARLNKKAPIAVLSADTSNFRAMVQQLTGIRTAYASPHIWGSCGSSGAPLLRPQPTRFTYNGGLSTLQTFPSFLGPKQIFPLLQRAQQPLMDGGADRNTAEQTPTEGRGAMVNYDALSSSPGLWDGMGNGTPVGVQNKGDAKELAAASLVSECEQGFPQQSASPFQGVLMSDDDLQAMSPFDAGESWLAFDGGVLTSYSS